MKIHNDIKLVMHTAPVWIVFRIENDSFVVNDHYPRYSEGKTPEEAIDNMFDDLFQPAGIKDFYCVPMYGAKRVRARPRRSYIQFENLPDPACGF